MKRLLIMALLLSLPSILLEQNFANARTADGGLIVRENSNVVNLQAKIIEFARSLTGIRYRYGSASPKSGFDCSGFINYVYRKFDILVPRSSAAFARVGREVKIESLKPGDLILFTGTNASIRRIGHIGMVVSRPGEPIRFIHSTSGKAYGVTETDLNGKYRKRYMKAIRIIPSAES